LDESGQARLRVPYATVPDPSHRGLGGMGLYRVRVGDRVRAMAVSDRAVREGQILRPGA
jgi:hypothetical protein